MTMHSASTSTAAVDGCGCSDSCNRRAGSRGCYYQANFPLGDEHALANPDRGRELALPVLPRCPPDTRTVPTPELPPKVSRTWQ